MASRLLHTLLRITLLDRAFSIASDLPPVVVPMFEELSAVTGLPLICRLLERPK